MIAMRLIRTKTGLDIYVPRYICGICQGVIEVAENGLFCWYLDTQYQPIGDISIMHKTCYWQNLDRSKRFLWDELYLLADYLKGKRNGES